MLQKGYKMKKKTYIKLMAATVLASTLLLGACGNKKETTQASSSTKTSQSSSSKATSSSKDNTTQASSSTSSDKTASSSQESNPTPQSPVVSGQGQEGVMQQASSQTSSSEQAAPVQSNPSTYDPTTDRKLQDQQAEHNKRYKGVLTMVDGDFSAAAGSWKGANGETITVLPSGQFTVETADGKKENYSIKGYSYTLDDGKYNAKVGGGKVIQMTTGADGAVSSVVLIQP